LTKDFSDMASPHSDGGCLYCSQEGVASLLNSDVLI
jgi:hypothetical protein